MSEPDQPPPLEFTPWVPERARADGWTADRQRVFIAALQRTGIVRDAACAAGRTARSAYKLRDKLGAEDFDRAWTIAQEIATLDAGTNALGIALNGERMPVVRKGRIVGERVAVSLGRQMRVFAALGRYDRGELARARAAEDRAYRLQTVRVRAELDRADAEAAAAAKAEREREQALWAAEAQAAHARRRPPGPRITQL